MCLESLSVCSVNAYEYEFGQISEFLDITMNEQSPSFLGKLS